MRWLLVVALASACGDNLEPVAALPDAAGPVTTAEWRVVTLAPPIPTTFAWNPESQVLVASDSYSTWQSSDGVWQPVSTLFDHATAAMYFEPSRHQIAGLGTYVTNEGQTLFTQAWNGREWHRVTEVDGVRSPIAGAYDPELRGPVMIAFDGTENATESGTLYSYDLGPLTSPIPSSQSVPRGSLGGPRAIHDAPTRSVIFAADQSLQPTLGVMYRIRRGVFVELPIPGELGHGFTLGTVDGFTELVVDGLVYRLEHEQWSPVSSGLPLVPPSALWQTRDGARHVLFERGEFVERAGRWVETPTLATGDYASIAGAPDGDGFTIFVGRQDGFAGAPVAVWQVRDGTLVPPSSRVMPTAPLARAQPVTLYAPGRGADVYAYGFTLFDSTPLTSAVLAYDGSAFMPISGDQTVFVQPNQATGDPDHHRIAALDSSRSGFGVETPLVTLDDDAAVWEPGPVLPTPTQPTDSLAFDPSLHRLVASQPSVDGSFDGTIYDLINGTWVLDASRPFGDYLVATDERYGLVALSSSGRLVWERTGGVWLPSAPLPHPTTSILGTAYDPVRRELAVLARIESVGGAGIVVFLRRRD